MREIKSYPELVDAIWFLVQGTPEDRERVDSMFSEEQITRQLEIVWSWESNSCVFGISQALDDLVDMGYCKGIDSFNGHRWRHIAPSIHCPDAPPSTFFTTLPLPKILPLRRQALQLIHELSICHEEGIVFYSQARITHQEATSSLFPTANEMDMYTARGTVIQAMSDLEKGGFVAGSISSGAFILRITLKGACWLLIVQPLLALEERAARLATNPEALEATKLLINAHSEAQRNAAGILYIALEKLENASGGERGIIALLSQSKAYISDLKQALQQHRHAATLAQAKLNHQECIKRIADIIERYITLREQINLES